jgi:glutamate racemase
VIYLADQAHVPYGSRTLEQVRAFSEGISHYLLSQGARLIVVACNTASAAALHSLRKTFPQMPFIGMEPAVKPAADHTHSGIIGVLATPATFQGALYASVVERFAQGVLLLQSTCPGLVGQIEAGYLDTLETRAILEKALQPMLEQGLDTVVLGCTHYPFVIPLIQEIVGPQVRVIDPAPAVARQAARVLGMLAVDSQVVSRPAPVGSNVEEVRFLTTGDPDRLGDLLPRLLGESGKLRQLYWESGILKDNQT